MVLVCKIHKYRCLVEFILYYIIEIKYLSLCQNQLTKLNYYEKEFI